MNGRGLFAVLAGITGVATIVAGVLICRGLVETAASDLLRAEAYVAAQVWAEARTSEAVEQVVPGRSMVTTAIETGLDEAVVRGRGTAREAAVAVYDVDGWQAVGTLIVRPGDAIDTVPPMAGPVTAILLVLAGMWVWSSGRRTRLGAGAFVGALVLGLGSAGSAAEQALSDLSTARLMLAVRALEAAPSIEAVIARPGGPQQLTGLPFLLLAASPRPTGGTAADVEFSALPTFVTEDLLASTPGPGGRVVLDDTPYRATQVGRVMLVLLPYEHVHTPRGLLLALLLAGMAVAILPISLSRYVDRPRLLRRTVVAWSFLAPALVHLAVFTIGPLVFAGWLSLHRWSLIDAARPFVGLRYYADLLGDAGWWQALRNTAAFTLHVPVSMALALGLALLTRGRRHGVAAIRAIFFLPTITSLVAIAIVWQWMLHDEVGIINWALGLVGLGPVPWLSSPRTAMPALMIMAVWLVVGYQMVLFQAGLAAIPAELYDAARMDGAGRWRRFMHVTVPGLRHTLFFVAVTSVIGSFQMFGAVYVMTGGGPLHATDVAVFHIYEEAWEYFRFGTAAAMSWMLFALIFVLTWLQFRVAERKVVSE